MLTAMTPVKGSAGYVAIERVTGTLAGKQGSFALQHTGTMDRGAQQLRISVVPDSGTGDLTGLTGELTIQIAGGQHSYEFQYPRLRSLKLHNRRAVAAFGRRRRDRTSRRAGAAANAP